MEEGVAVEDIDRSGDGVGVRIAEAELAIKAWSFQKREVMAVLSRVEIWSVSLRKAPSPTQNLRYIISART